MTFVEAFKKQLLMALTFSSAFIIVRTLRSGFSSLSIVSTYNSYVMVAIFISYMVTGIYFRMNYNIS